MKNVSQETTDAWLSGIYTDARKPTVRATISKVQVLLSNINISPATTGDPSRLVEQIYASAIFGQAFRPIELPNVTKMTWSRSVDDSVASADITVKNTEMGFPGETREPGSYVDGDFGYPGWYTWNRGTNLNPWGLTPTGWQDIIIPDRVIRTYEGYGSDPNVAPEDDPNLYASGVWLIDSVTYNGDEISIKCRDLGRILLDHLWMPPVVPGKHYPLNFEKYWKETIEGLNTLEVNTGYFHPAYSNDSGVVWFGWGTPVFGHLGSHAVDADPKSYWLSMGNSQPSAPYSFEWVEGKFGAQKVTAVQFTVVGGPYTCYVSVNAGGAWQGTSKVPYDPHHWASYPNGSDIPFVSTFTVGANATYRLVLPKAYANATNVRLTFTALWNSGMKASTTAGGGKYSYRAAVSDFQVSGATPTIKPGTEDTYKDHGNYGDFTDLIKLVLAYGGWYWPSSGDAFVTKTDGTVVTISPASDDPMLGKGRVWGDFEVSGITAYGPKGEFRSDEFDKQPLMDCITKIKEILGFAFYIDERGGAVFRPVNMFNLGNYIQAIDPFSSSPDIEYGRTDEIVEIAETDVLSSISATLSSANVREKIFVAAIDGGGADGKLRGAVVDGWNPAPSGFRRVAGWSDKNFTDALEAVVMADMIALRQMFRYRTNSVVIPGYPKITVDDQIKLTERMTNDTYVHHVRTIQSTYEASSGKWTYTLETEWLGEDPLHGIWAFNLTDLAPETVAYLKSLGLIPPDTVVPPPEEDIPGAGSNLPPEVDIGDFKGHLGGLLATASTAYDSGVRPLVKGYTYDLTWAAAQTSNGGTLQASVITALQSENARANSAGLDIRLQIHAGKDAPAWAKTINGFSPLDMLTPTGSWVTVGPFWRTDYLDAYEDFLHKLVDVIGPLSRFKEVTVAGCDTVSTSLFDKGWDALAAAGGSYIDDVLAAGYSASACETAFLRCIRIHRAPMNRNGMTSVLPVNLYRRLNDDGTIIDKDAVVYDCMNEMARSSQIYGPGGPYTGLLIEGAGDHALAADILTLRGDRYKDLWNNVAAYGRSGRTGAVACSTLSLPEMKGTYAYGAPTPYGTAFMAASKLGAFSVQMPVGFHNDTSSAPIGNTDPDGKYQITTAEAGTLNKALILNRDAAGTGGGGGFVTSWRSSVESTVANLGSAFWYDDFSIGSIDTTKWNVYSGQYGNPGEEQIYLPRNVYVQDGSLVLRAVNETYVSSGTEYAWTSGMVTTRKTAGGLKFKHTTGYWEARMKLPRGSAFWPAFWLVGPNDGTTPGWPDYGEFDVMEGAGARPDMYLQTFHYRNTAGNHDHTSASNIYNIVTKGVTSSDQGPLIDAASTYVGATSSWHNYGFWWESSKVAWLIDGRVCRYVDAATSTLHVIQPDGGDVTKLTLNLSSRGLMDIFNYAHSIILNLAVGGPVPTGHGYNGTHYGDEPGLMLIDHVRVWAV